jgi:hypothetical protein
MDVKKRTCEKLIHKQIRVSVEQATSEDAENSFLAKIVPCLALNLV